MAAGATAVGAEGARRTADRVTLFLAGDVMTGRGIDQILPHPCDPRLREPWVTSAADYVSITERTSGPIERPVPFPYPWGDALDELDRRAPDLRIVNLESALTRSGERAPKGIHYRTSPENAEVLAAAGLDACVLANNHVLDFGPEGLGDTLDALDRLGIARAGAGRGRSEAHAPATLSLPGGGRVLLFARGAGTSGVPAEWAARRAAPGIAFFPKPSRAEADRMIEDIAAWRRPGDLVVASLHWGPNWGYRVERAERAFARRLVDKGGVHLVHGHSSHHPRPLEVHRGRPILYGCGDFLNDYEGIGGHEAYRPELVLMYFVTLGRPGGRLLELDLVPFRVRRFRLERTSGEAAAWIARTLTREGRGFGARIQVAEREGGLRVAAGDLGGGEG